MSAPRFTLRGPPLGLQITVLLLGGLIVAQIVTLFLTLLLPPAPTPQYGLDDIAAALADRRGEAHDGLRHLIQSGPPDVSGPGWLVSEKSRRELARLMNVDEGRVALAFYTPLPFAGTTTTRFYVMADDGPLRTLASLTAEPETPRLVLAQYSPPSLPGGGPAPSMKSGRAALPARDAFPPGMFPGSVLGPPGQGMVEVRRLRGAVSGQAGAERTRTNLPLISVDPRYAQPGGVIIPGDGGSAIPPLLRGETAGAPVPVPVIAGKGAASGSALAPALVTTPTPVAPNAAITSVITLPGGALMPRSALPGPSALMPLAPFPAPAPSGALIPPMPAPAPQIAPPARGIQGDTPRALRAPPEIGGPTAGPIAPPPPLLRARPVPALVPDQIAPPAGPPIAISPAPRALFGLAPAPFVEGDFVAALRLADGRWSVVQPSAQPFPNSWQQRVLLWFAISLALVVPVGWLFTRRLVKPLDRFARAAEQLGRDPSSTIVPLDGPAEIGRAAHAFNLMQGRLRAFVDDRTAMVGAISHDLRTPLTRMRFRIEDVDADDVRDGLLEEVEAMEGMIAQVIDYIRDASTPGARERLDLGTLVEEAVEDARLVGGQVVIEHAVAAPVEVDVLGVRRVLDNLLENAIKYGDRARIRLRTEAGSAIAEIIDEGPGLPEDELERAFEPFYRSEAARASAKSGSGLGLAVCRSIARAHGGDVRLHRSGEGFTAEMRMPLVFDAERPLAA